MVQGKINYIEKGFLLHEAVHNAGHHVREENGVWYGDDADAVQAIIDGFDPMTQPRKDKRAALDAEFQRRIDAGRVIGDKTFQIDGIARANFSGAAALAIVAQKTGGWNPEFQWRAADNSYQALPTPEAMIALAADIGDYYSGLMSRLFELKDQIGGAASAEDCASIDLTSGWPSNP